MGNLDKWSSVLVKRKKEQELQKTALELCDYFEMTTSQKRIAIKLLNHRMQVIWGPPVSIKTFDE